MAKISIKRAQADIVRIFIPVAREDVAQNSLAFREAKRISGGFTCRRVTGGWVDPAGNEIVEPVDEFEFISAGCTTVDIIEALTYFAEELLKAGEQAVLIVEQDACAKVTSHYLTLE